MPIDAPKKHADNKSTFEAKISPATNNNNNNGRVKNRNILEAGLENNSSSFLFKFGKRKSNIGMTINMRMNGATPQIGPNIRPADAAKIISRGKNI